MDSLYKPEGRRGALAAARGRRRASTTPTPIRRASASSIAHPPPNVTGDLHLGPRAAALARRHDRPHAADAGLQRPLPAGLRPRRASRRRTRSRSTSRPRGRRARTSAARRSRPASGNGCASTAARSCPSSGGSAPRSTTGASASRWTTAYVRAVMRFFVHLYGKGWIYRANRIINWCPFHLTSLSDLEVAHVERRRRADVRPLSVRGRRRATSRSRPCGRRRSSPTSRSPCIRRTSATATLVGSEVSCRTSSAACP